MKKESPGRTLARAAYLHQVAVESRKSAAEMDQMAARMERRVRPEGEPIVCCQPGACMICGADSPSGHVHVDLPGSSTAWRLPIGRVCSSHTFWEAAKTNKLITYIEGESEDSA